MLKKTLSLQIWFIIIFQFLTITKSETTIISASQYVGCGVNGLEGKFGLAPLFDLTFESGTIWQFKNLSMRVPDQMIVSDLMVNELSVIQQVTETFDEFFQFYKSWYQFSFGFQSEFDLAFQYDQQLIFVHQFLNEQTSFLIHGLHFWELYRATLYPPYILKLNPLFLDSINDLPETINNQYDYEKYQEFISSFGTHYLSEASFGGRIDYNNIIDQSLLKRYSNEWITQQYSLSFYYNLYGIDDGGFESRDQINISVDYQQSRIQNQTFYGGDPRFTNNLIEWLNSVPIYAYPLNGTLVGIWELFPQNENNTLKIQTFQNFINNIDQFSFVEPQSFQHNSYPPGLNCIGSGFNVATFQGCLSPLFQWTYSLNQTYPDQVFVTPTPNSLLMYNNITMTNTFDFSTWQTTFYSSSFGFLGMGTSTSQVYEFYSLYYKQSRSLSQMWLYITYSTITLPLIQIPKLDPIFQTAIDNLPVVYNETTSIFYQEFIETFGLAFPDRITLGGSLTMSLWYDLFFLNQNGISWVIDNSQMSFAGILGDGEGHSSFSNQIDHYFLQTMNLDFEFQGGDDVSSIQPNQYKEWLSSILTNMVPITYHLQPITMLIDNLLIRENMDIAIGQYLNKSITTLTNFIQNYSNF